MWSRRFITLLLGCLVGLFDVTISPWLPAQATAIRLSLPLVVSLSVFSRLERATTVALVAGILLDIFSPSVSFVSIRYVLVALSLFSLSQTVFTNRSLVGIQTMGLGALLADRLLVFLFETVARLIGRDYLGEVRAPLLAEALWMLLLLSLVFLLMASFTRRFLPPLSRPSV